MIFYSIIHIPYRQNYIVSIPHPGLCYITFTRFHVTCDALFMKPNSLDKVTLCHLHVSFLIKLTIHNYD